MTDAAWKVAQGWAFNGTTKAPGSTEAPPSTHSSTVNGPVASTPRAERVAPKATPATPRAQPVVSAGSAPRAQPVVRAGRAPRAQPVTASVTPTAPTDLERRKNELEIQTKEAQIKVLRDKLKAIHDANAHGDAAAHRHRELLAEMRHSNRMDHDQMLTERKRHFHGPPLIAHRADHETLAAAKV